VARTLRRTGLTVALPALVGVSTLLHWLAGRRLTGLWIMPDEAIYGERALGLWNHFSLPVLHGAGSGYSVLYPVVAGLPLSIGPISRGYASLKLLQALVVSLSAVPVLFYGRRVMPPAYALAAAALTVASPLLLYSGLVMTEVLYYPLAAVALVAIARALATATRRDQAIALLAILACVLTRVQAVVLVGVFAAAILVDAGFARQRARIRLFSLVWALLGLAAVATLLRPGIFGAYAGTISGEYPLGASLRLIYYHLAYTVLLVAIAPVAALVLLVVEGTRGQLRDAAERPLVAVALSTFVLVVVQVGLFSARYAPHLLGRDLAALPPILFLVFAAWLGRGAPRPSIAASAAVLGVAAVALAAPWDRLVVDEALPDTLGIASLLQQSSPSAATQVAIAVAVVLAIVRFVPRRLAPLLVVVVGAILVVSSVSAADLLARKVQFDQAALVGTPRDWIERSADSDVTYVYNGDIALWNVVWQQRFWNPRIHRVVALRPFEVPGPLPEVQIRIPPDGRLGVDDRYVVANDVDTFIGTPVAHQDRGPDDPGLTLWRVTPPARISTIESGVTNNGDIETSASVTAFGCNGGRLELTLLPKATNVVRVLLDGKEQLRANIEGLPYWNGTVSVPATHRSSLCRFKIEGGLLLGSTRIAFAR
jgi:hypothetical protein